MQWLGIAAAVTLALGGAHDDPLAGVWKGTARGDGTFLSRHGAPATFLFERDADGALAGRAIFQGMETGALTIRVEDGDRALELSGSVADIPVRIHLARDGERLSGEMVAVIGLSVEVEVRRISREVLAAPPTDGAPSDLASVRAEHWVEDLRFLQAYLPQVHANAYHSQSREDWERSIDALAARLPELDAHERTLAAARVVAAVGDAHTGLNWREVPGFGSVPVAIRSFADGVFVTGVHEAAADALAARVVRVGDVPIDAALERLAGVITADNDVWRAHQTPGLLAVPRLLFVLGLSDSPAHVPLAVAVAGEEPVEVAIGFEREGPWLAAPDPAYETIPRWQRNTQRAYWFELLQDRGALYFAYNACRQDPQQSFADCLSEALAAFDGAGARRFVIDLRNNGGGNSAILSAELKRLSGHPVIGAPGGLAALTGSRTYSSGTWAARELREHGAKLLGTPTGGKPNTYGDVRWFRLPHTRLQVLHSTKYFRPFEDEDPPFIAPDVRVDLRADEHFAGLDPVLERALE